MSHKTTPQQFARCLEALKKGLSTSKAIEAGGFSQKNFYDYMHEDPEWKAAVTEAREIGADVYEDEAHRRAVTGVLRPIYQGGKLVGHERIYSDRMLELKLKAKKPGEYREKVEVMGKDGGPIQQEHTLSDEDLEHIARGSSKRAAASAKGSPVSGKLRTGGGRSRKTRH